MRAQNIGYEHKAQTAVGTLGGEKRREKLCCGSLRDALAVVGDGKATAVLTTVGCRYVYADFTVESVADAFD